MSQVKVLFVCLGNICRSPSAQGVFERVVADAGLTGQVVVDSCGTGDWHVGKAPDARAIDAALRRGVDIRGLRARQFAVGDLDTFDYILVMDRQNLADIKSFWRQQGGTEPQLFLSYGGQSTLHEVPDPYYGGEQGFEEVLDLIEEASRGLLGAIREHHL
ncbi:low molecular weight protein-tyrosine-phosphatase [Marinobacter zhejiangensis]|uniref:protein-tyrosine-phosphatase n=1 Tax=Marinobacter zhejiangensis TaxID=488535 RepID=A0A1I4RIW7_9GAMM|nr:low molecular weight protein-tyrosine-phosphatase [Marinobacter zhejiangensis]SFM52212.1 protein-tyrosine phosphatase [Marinobacter zhejiangensis]